MTHIRWAKALTDDCALAYNGTFTPSQDLPSQQNVVHYKPGMNQRKYVHMYFGKYVGLWREIRRQLAWDDGPVCSIGAGPGLCAFGWFWELPPQHPVELVDVLPWDDVRQLPSHAALTNAVLGHQFPWRLGRLAIGPTPQTNSCNGVSDYIPPDNATILLPFIANHIVGRHLKIQQPATFWTYLDQLRTNGHKIVVADICKRFAPDLWSGAPSAVSDFSYNAAWLQHAYTTQGPRRTSTGMCSASVLVGTHTGWSTLP